MASTTWASLGRRTEGQSCKDTSDSTRGVCRGRTAQHHAVELGRRAHRLGRVGQAAVEHEYGIRKIALQPRDHVVAQRRDFPVVAGRQALEHRVARMGDEDAAAGVVDLADEVADECIRVVVVQPRRCPTVTGMSTASCMALMQSATRSGSAIRRGAECAALHALRGAAAVQVDFVVAPLSAQPGALRQRVRSLPPAAGPRDARPRRNPGAARRCHAAARRW